MMLTGGIEDADGKVYLSGIGAPEGDGAGADDVAASAAGAPAFACQRPAWRATVAS